MSEGAVEVLREVELAKTPDEVWAVIGPYNGLPAWMPPIDRSEEELRDGERIRHLHLQAGGVVIERLIELDDGARRCVYAITDSPLPVENYVATLSAAAAGQGTRVTWRATFDAKGATEHEAAEVIGGIFAGGLANLKEMMRA